MNCLITGGAGFIGSNLARRLVAEGHGVTIFDNLSLGRKEFLAEVPGAKLLVEDLLDREAICAAMRGRDMVFHLAANSDIDFGRRHTDADLRQGTLATYNVLEAMRRSDARRIVFSSTSAVYGERGDQVVAEDDGPFLPISFYGASKLACEGLISAFGHNYAFQSWILRFANIVGRNGTHGVILDFIKKLRRNPRRLDILGDGRQSKPYVLVDECLDAMSYAVAHADGELNVFNLCCDGGTEVRAIAQIVASEMGLKDVEFHSTGERRGWAGDVPKVRMSPEKLGRLGWRARHDSDETVRLATRELLGKQ